MTICREVDGLKPENGNDMRRYHRYHGTGAVEATIIRG
jgi:hypothetical protein